MGRSSANQKKKGAIAALCCGFFFFCVFVKYLKQRIHRIIDKQECTQVVSASISSEFELEGLDAAFTLQAKYSSFPFAPCKIFFFSPTLLGKELLGE